MPTVLQAVSTTRCTVCVLCGAAPVPQSDTANQDALDGPPVERCQDGGWSSCSSEFASLVLSLC